MLETLGEDYVLTARAKGLPQRMVVRRHALRNAMLPTTTLIALSLGYIVAGSILVETVFSWPGIGQASTRPSTERDYPMLQGAFLVLTLSVVFFNFAGRPPVLPARPEDRRSERLSCDRDRAGRAEAASRPRRVRRNRLWHVIKDEPSGAVGLAILLLRFIADRRASRPWIAPYGDHTQVGPVFGPPSATTRSAWTTAASTC